MKVITQMVIKVFRRRIMAACQAQRILMKGNQVLSQMTREKVYPLPLLKISVRR
jgi:hypothetical protein